MTKKRPKRPAKIVLGSVEGSVILLLRAIRAGDAYSELEFRCRDILREIDLYKMVAGEP